MPPSARARLFRCGEPNRLAEEAVASPIGQKRLWCAEKKRGSMLSVHVCHHEPPHARMHVPHAQVVGRLLSAQPPAAISKPPPLASHPSVESGVTDPSPRGNPEAADGDDERTFGLDHADSVLSEDQSGIASLPGMSTAKAK